MLGLLSTASKRSGTPTLVSFTSDTATKLVRVHDLLTNAFSRDIAYTTPVLYGVFWQYTVCKFGPTAITGPSGTLVLPDHRPIPLSFPVG